MTSLEHNILKLRVYFHKRLAESLGLEVEIKTIEELVKQQSDEEIFRLIEIESQNKKQTRTISPFRIIKIPRNLKLLQRLTTPSLFVRLKSFFRK